MVDPEEFKDVNLSIKAFEKMKNLRVLKIDKLSISGDFELLSKELRWLSWQKCPLEGIPSSFPVGKLAVLRMSGSNIQEFGVNLQCFKSLKTLVLTDCKLLKRTPNFTGATSLESLWLGGCSSLTEIHQSIGNLDKLVELDLSRCIKLRDLPSGICHLKSLQFLNITLCLSIKTLPIDFGDLRSLKTLFAHQTGIKQWPTPVEMKRDADLVKADDIPWNIGNLSSLECLVLNRNIFHCLPLDLSKLLWLEELSLDECWNLQTLSVANLEYLRKIQLTECKKLVNTELHNLPSISRINMVGCSSLQNPFNQGFFSAHALALKSREDRNLVMKPELHIVFQCDEIPDWCSNRVRASSICFTMPTHNKEYKFLGMVLWFVCKDWVLEPAGFTFSIADKMPAGTFWPRHCPSLDLFTGASYSYVFYRSYLETPFDEQMKGGEKIQVVEKCDKENAVNQIGIHLLYLDQHGRVISLPAEAVMDQDSVNLKAPNLGRRGIKKFITN